MGNEGKEKVPDPEVKENKGPSDPHDAYQRFLKVKAEKDKAAAETQPDPSEGKKDGQKADPEKEGDVAKEIAAKNPWKNLRIVDEKGNPVKAPLQVDGESIEIDDINKLMTAAQFGFHHDKKGKALKVQEEELQKKIQEFELESASFKKGMPLFEKLQTALSEGRLKIADDGSVTQPSGEVIDEDHIPLDKDDEEYTDSQFVDLAKRFNKLIDKNKKLETDLNALKQFQLAQLFSQERSKIDTEIEKNRPKYPLATEKEVIDLLAELDDQNRPRYTVEEAMKIAQESEKKKFDAYIKSDPDFMKKTDEEKEQIIQDYLSEIKEKNKHPVSGPQGTGAAGVSLNRERKKEDPTKSMTPEERKKEAADHFSGASKFLSEKVAQAKKS